jgi:hypothetical protein
VQQGGESFTSVLRELFSEEGFAGLYGGSATALGKGFVNNFVFYYAFSLIRRFVFGGPVKKGEGSILRSMLHGIYAGLCVQLIMSPYDTALTRVMTFRKKRDGSKAPGLLETVLQIYRERGLGGFYAGIVPMLVLTLNPGITTVVRTQLTRGRRLSPRQNFWIGAASKAVASTCTYPIVIAKVQLQARHRTDDAERLPTMVNCLWRIFRAEGVDGLYKGCSVQVGQSVVKEAILNAVRLEIYEAVMSAFVTSSAAVSR